MRTVKDKVRWIMSTSEQTMLPLRKFSKFLESDTNIVIYGDVGVTCDSLNRTYYGLVQALGSDVAISVLTAENVRQGEWRKKANLFVVPGGATTPMRACLASEGVAEIQRYVKQGGCYLGLCAGAYFACEHIEFAKGNSTLERIVTKGNLNFFSGKGIGPLTGRYEYIGADGLDFVALDIMEDATLNQSAYSHGGCYFESIAADKSSQVLARYMDYDNHPAVVLCKVEKGKALLSGVHLEYDSILFDADELEISQKKQLNDAERLQLFRYFLHKLLN